MKEKKLPSFICCSFFATTAAFLILIAPDITRAGAGPTAKVWNIEEVGHSDLSPEGSIREYSKLSPWPNTDGYYLYSGCYPPNRGFMIIDLSDTANPKPLSVVRPYNPIKSPSPEPGDPKWSQTTPVEGWDPGWNTHTHFVAYHSNLLVVNQERYRFGTPYQDHYRGIKVYDVTDRKNPIFLSYYALPGKGSGAHHFFFDGRYVYLGGEYEGFDGKILVIVDLKDPRNPVEAGKWWVPGQKQDEVAKRDWIHQEHPNPVTWVRTKTGQWLPKKHVGMHYAEVVGNRAYLSYHQAGLIILDVTDRSNPKFISRLDYHYHPESPEVNPESSLPGNSHSTRLCPGRKLLALSDEVGQCPFGWVRFVDISDETKPKVISEFKLPENSCSVYEKTGDGSSTHIGNFWNSNLLFQAWYGMGLRVIDISDLTNPKEVGYYIPPEIGKWTGIGGLFDGISGGKIVNEYRDYVSTYDVVFGPGGLLYLSDGAGGGLRVLRYTGPGME